MVPERETGHAASVPSNLRHRRAAVLATLPLRARAQAPLAFSSVSVDVSHLRAIGVGHFADLVQGAMTDELNRLYADRLGARGPRLVVRVTALILTSIPTGQGFRGSSTDAMDGEAVVVGARGEMLARYPQHAALVPMGAWYDPLADQRRTAALARTYAQWLSRAV